MNRKADVACNFNCLVEIWRTSQGHRQSHTV